MPIIRDDGKAYKLYFATDTDVIFSLPGDYNPAGKTFSLAVRAVRDIHTPALAEATGTVSGQIVTFAVDTNTQSFADALAAGISQAWLEIYVGDEDVLLQRPVSIEPRAGSLEGQPPAPVVLYYTAAQTDAAISTAIGTHNADPNAHAGMFDPADAAYWEVSNHNASEEAHTALFDAAENFATGAVSEHNGDPAAHDGSLLPAASAGEIPVFNGSGWTARPYGDKVQAVTGDFIAAPGVLYTLTLSANKTIYIEAGSQSDFDFGLLVTQGATAYTLTLIGEMYPILFPDDNVPPRYASGNTPPGIGTANTAYMFRFHWDAKNSVLLANLAYSVEVSA